MGMFDNIDPSDKRTALAMALLRAGSAMNRGPTREPQNFLSNLSRGASEGMESYLGTASSLQDRRNNQGMLDIKRKLLQDQLEEAGRQKTFRDMLAKNIQDPVTETRTSYGSVPADIGSGYVPPPDVEAPPQYSAEDLSGMSAPTAQPVSAPEPWKPSTAYMGNIGTETTTQTTRAPNQSDYLDRFMKTAQETGMTKEFEWGLGQQTAQAQKQAALEEVKAKRMDTFWSNLKNVPLAAKPLAYGRFAKEFGLPPIPEEAWTTGMMDITLPNGTKQSVEIKDGLDYLAKSGISQPEY
jgi:hypothetical protein